MTLDELAERFVETRATGDLAGLRACLHADLVVRSNTSPWVIDRERLIGMIRERHDRLTTTHIEVVRREALPDGFLLEEVLHGSFEDGEVLAVPSCVVATCAEDLITSLTQYHDSEAGTPLLDQRSRVWRLASTIARNDGRSRFTAVDVVRSAAALGLLTTTPLDPTAVELDQFGPGIDERAEAEMARHTGEGRAGDGRAGNEPTVPCPAPALPALDLMALAALMARPVAARGPGATGVLEDVIAALVSNAPFRRQLAEVGIDPRPLTEEWIARRDALPATSSEPTALGADDLARLTELAGPPPPGWDREAQASGEDETETETERRVAAERQRGNELAARVAAGGDQSDAATELREELRFEIAQWIRRHGTNGRSVDEAFEDAMRAVLEAAKAFDPADRYSFRTRATAAYVGAIRGSPGGRAHRAGGS